MVEVNEGIVVERGMKDADKNPNEAPCGKYIWLHRAQVLAIFYLVFNVIGHLLDTLALRYLFLPALLFYLLRPKAVESVFKCTKKFYLYSFFLGGLTTGFGAGLAPNLPIIIDILGYKLWYVTMFIFLNSLYMLVKAFKIWFDDIPKEIDKVFK
jgi:hypothetical protein